MLRALARGRPLPSVEASSTLEQRATRGIPLSPRFRRAPEGRARRAVRVPEKVLEPAAAAASAETIAQCDDLRYSSDSEPGIRRRKAGSGFYYVLPDGRRVTDDFMLARIRKLAVPPAYRDVWICMDGAGHLQATGIDARGRKQYRYHERWRSVRDAHKFERMVAFGRALPRIHRRIGRDLKLPGLPRERVLATIVRLLERTLIRVGNAEYAKSNGSYGLTTLRNRHATVKGSVVRFSFRGKHGIRHCIEVDAPRSAKVIRGCLDLPGQELFQYIDQDGQVHDLGSSDVNGYLKAITGRDFTAKDFRTWYATSEALESLCGVPFRTAKEAKANLKAVLECVAKRLGNTPTMCRKCYINPVVMDAFLAGQLRQGGALKAGDARAQLLQLLSRTPQGAGFGGAPKKKAARSKKRLR
jgi:DNA topoisomerase-1